MNAYEQAALRVQNDESLAIHTDLLLEYDWPNMDEHLEWVIYAETGELIEWAEALKCFEEEAE